MLDALRKRGYSTIPEPGRRIVAEELRVNGRALPWVDSRAFAQRAVQMALTDLAVAKEMVGLVFFDRGLIDAAVARECAGGPPYRSLCAGKYHYAKYVFLAPPWPEIYVTDAERKNSFDEAKAEYQRLVRAFSELGYVTCELPKAAVADRADFVLKELGVTK